jgi:hypothetical protein
VNPPADARAPITYNYTFSFEDGTCKTFTVTLDGDTLAAQPPPDRPLPEWTRLGFNQCPGCPLKTDEHERCPPAAALADVIHAFKDRKSFAPVQVTVESENRTYTWRGAIQKGASPLVGLYMVTSGCPVLDRLRPLVETHLPFMSRHETMYRILALHLVSQFFAQRRGEPLDVELAGLRRRMDEIRDVNVAFCTRLRGIDSLDASVNAVVILATMGDFPAQKMMGVDMERLERLLREYYER